MIINKKASTTIRSLLTVISVMFCTRMVTVATDDFAITLTVKEPVGIARSAEPASGGIPFKKGQVKSVEQLALFEKSGKSVPAQFTKLAGYEDGSVQWALADFRVTVPANGAAEYVVKTGSPPASDGIRVIETADTVTVHTGVLEFGVNKTRFNLLEWVKVQDTVVTGVATSKAVRIVGVENGEFTAGMPDRVLWEYKGPERITLRIDGCYRNDKGETFLSYTTRLTTWAGMSVMRIDHKVRNSDPGNGLDAKIKEATLSIPLAFTAQEQGKGYDWIAGGDGKVGLLVVNRNSGGCFPGESTYSRRKGRPGQVWSQTLYKQAIANGRLEVAVIPPPDTQTVPGTETANKYGYDKGNTFFALADCAHKNSQIVLDFYTGARDAAANAVREKALRSPLHALADPNWISETETIGVGRFGTLADEIATYQKWGWKKWDAPEKQPRAPAEPRAYVARESIHGTTETDSVEGLTLMYIRTGERGFLDWARAWAEYGVTHYAYRTDGFTFGRERKGKFLRSDVDGPIGWGDSRSEQCHYYAAGLFDYYCLTGEMDVLEGARDLVEQAVEWSVKRFKKGGVIGYYGVRAFARQWLGLLRQAQLTRSPDDRRLADALGEVALTCADWDPRGFVNWGGADYVIRLWIKPAVEKCPRLQAYLAEKGITYTEKGLVTDRSGASWMVRCDGGSWEQCALQMAFERYYRATGNEEARVRAIKMAEFGRDCQISKKCQQAFYYTVVDFPERGRVFDIADWDDEHRNCPGPGAKHSGYYTRCFPDVFGRAYGLSGDKQWLDLARMAWNRGSKRGYQTPDISAPDDEVFVFAFHDAPSNDAVLSTCRMFYEVPRAK